MPRGRPRSTAVPESSEPPITIEEARRRGLWAVYCVRAFVVAAAGVPPVPIPGIITWGGAELVAWTVDEKAAGKTRQELARDDLFPDGGRHQLDRRSHGPRMQGARP